MMTRLTETANEPTDDLPPFVDEGEPPQREPMRRCIVTGTVQPKERLLRFVVTPDGTLVADVEGRLPGRGYWLEADRKTMERALAKKAFARAARRPVNVSTDFLGQVETRLRRRCLDLIGLARGAGQVVTGFEQVREALLIGRINRAGPAALMIEARDGAEDGRRKLQALAPGIPVIDLFDADALGAALGRHRAVHAAVAQGRLSEQLTNEAARLQGLASATKTPQSGQPPAASTNVGTR